jgi:hypothetical protein
MSFLKKIIPFSGKEVNNDSLINNWRSSKKSMKELEGILMRVTDNNLIIREISGLLISNINDINNFIRFLRAQTIKEAENTILKKSFNKILKNAEFLGRLLENLTNSSKNPTNTFENLSELIFLNKYEILFTILKRNTQYISPQIKDFLFFSYLPNHSEYIKIIQLSLYSEEEKQKLFLEFFLPNVDNYKFLISNNCIQIKVSFSFLFNQRIINDTSNNELLDLYLNLFCDLDEAKLLKPDNIEKIKVHFNDEKLNFILKFYKHYQNILLLNTNQLRIKTFREFVRNSIESSINSHFFETLSKLSVETFKREINAFFINVIQHSEKLKLAQKTIIRIPFSILIYFLNNKSPTSLIKSYLEIIYSHYQKDNDVITKFEILFIKKLIENYSEDQHTLQIFKNILEDNRSNFISNEIKQNVEDLLKDINFLDVLYK